MAKIEARAHLLTFLINTTLGYECIANSIFKHSLHLTGRLTSLCLVFTVPVLSTLLYLKRMLSYDRSESVPMTAYTAPQIKARHPVNRRAFCSSITAASAATRGDVFAMTRLRDTVMTTLTSASALFTPASDTAFASSEQHHWRTLYGHKIHVRNMDAALHFSHLRYRPLRW
jgi:hypothetical protein